MENFYNKLNREGKDLSTTTSVRLDSRPVYPHYGGLAEDHGCTLKTGLPKKNGSRSQAPSGYQKFHSATSRPSSQGKTRDVMRSSHKEGDKEKDRNMAVQRSADKRAHLDAIEFSDSESDDEMDLLSSQADFDDPSSFQEPVLRHRLASTKHISKDAVNLKGSPPQRGVHVDSNGREHHYHPNFHPSNVYSHLKFKKNKIDSKLEEIPASSKPSSSLLPSRLDLTGHNYGGTTVESKRPHEVEANDNGYVKKTGSLKKVNSSQTMESPPRRNSQQAKPRSVTLSDQPEFDQNNKPRPRPKPRLVSKKQTDQKSQPRSNSRSRSRSQGGLVATLTPAAFPIISPPSSPVFPSSKTKTADFPSISPLRDLNPHLNHEPRRPKPLGSCSRLPNPFPMVSPPPKRREEREEARGRTHVKRTKEKGKLKENDDVALFSRSEGAHDKNELSFVTSKKGKGKGKEKERVSTVENERQQREKLNKFPMSTQMLESIDSSPPSWQGKRSSEGGSEDERITKKSKTESDTFIESPSHAYEDFDSIMISPDVDPQSLCPYCDMPLPTAPSVHLLSLLVSTRKKSKPDPRPSNPLGLKAPMSVFVTACQRHRFESQILPEAERKGWPKTVDWKAVANRVLNMKAALEALVNDSGDMAKGAIRDAGREEDEWEVPYGRRKRKNGPKESSIFWNEVMEEVKQKGSRAVAGVRGQFENFEKAQPGYYGEQGSVIIHQTLYDMFPPNSMNPSSIAPLTGSQFMEKVLVPEVALRLIMEDKQLDGEKGKQDALTTLRESSAYGVFMFPEDGGESNGAKRLNRDKLGVGDMIVMERAMKRRKELEEEEKWQAEERATIERNKPRRNKKDARKVTGSRGGAIEMQTPSKEAAPPKPIPRPISKRSSSTSIFSVQEERQRSQTRRSRSRSVHGDTDPASGFETAIEISESDCDDSHQAARQDRWQPSETVKGQQTSTSSTSQGLARLKLCSDSDPDAKTSVETRRMTRSRSRSVLLSQDASSTEVVRESNGSDVEVLDTPTSKTPVVNRRVADVVDNDKTPMAAKQSQKGSTPPLLRAKQRRNGLFTRQILGTSKTSLETRINYSNGACFPPSNNQQDDFEWLLKDYSSSSQ